MYSHGIVGILMLATAAVEGKEFLQPAITQLGAQPAEEDVINSMLKDLLSSSETPNITSARIAQLEADLQPLFEVLPKNQHGKLGTSVARYALHRLFEQRNRWTIRGLTPADQARNGSATGKLPVELESSHLSRALGDPPGDGFGVHGLAVVAATLDEFVRVEVIGNLKKLHQAMYFEALSIMDDGDLGKMLEMYMLMYIAGATFENLGLNKFLRVRKFAKTFTDWPTIEAWLNTTVPAVVAGKGECPDGGECVYDLEAVVAALTELIYRYSGLNDKECLALKSQLLTMETMKTGRVKLADFYKAGLSGAWNFSEKAGYLRALGALDESQPREPKVIVPNYVSSWVNCLKATKVYGVCCRNECEDLIGHIEQHVRGPTASPEQVLRLVSALPSDTVPAPRNLSALLAERMHKIAARHDGRVPIHGRLFAQWMHHAYPRECAYPHEAGATGPLTPDQWLEEAGVNQQASVEEMQRYVDAAGSIEPTRPLAHVENLFDDEEEEAQAEMQWTDVEELLVIRENADDDRGGSASVGVVGIVWRLFMNIFSNKALLLMEASTVVMIWYALRTPRKKLPCLSKGKDFDL